MPCALLILILLTWPCPSFASDVVWTIAPPFVPSDLQKLADFKKFQKTLSDFLSDPTSPPDLKRVIQVALASDTKFYRLNRKTRADYGVAESATASFINLATPFFLDRQNAPAHGRGNSAATQAMLKNQRKQPEHLFNIFNQNRAITANSNDLLALIHEFGHIYFIQYFYENIELLAKKYPELIKIGPERIDVDTEFFDMASERFAYETEYWFLKSQYQIRIPFWSRKFKMFAQDSSNLYLIAHDFLTGEIYDIYNPRVTKLLDYSLDELFPNLRGCSVDLTQL